MEIDLQSGLSESAFAFRGYNLTNLGRSSELLEHAAYGRIVRKHLLAGSRICSDVTERNVDLVSRVRQGRETSLKTYSDAISIVVCMELAQLELLQEFFGIDYRQSKLLYGYSLGEVAAVIAGGVHDLEGPLRVLLTHADEVADLAHDVTMGVLFSRGPELPLNDVQRQCVRINSEGRGVIGVSAYLSPNSVLLLGQGDTVDRFKDSLREVLPDRIYLRKNAHRWPPMHTCIVWERNIPNRSALMMHTIQGGFKEPQPEIFSLVTGDVGYHDYNARELLCRWIDQPQHLWTAVYATLARGVETLVHVGPQPNLIPATFKRLSVDVEGQTRGSVGMRALSNIIRRPWLSALLPSRTALLRAPLLKHVNLEDWLLQHQPD
ncbi:MAG: ACP S-malonyltransferase [Planctomycetaceae bacterium]|nr:ACP S-malonyltransferase [Planctomycetaceae bacterium]